MAWLRIELSEGQQKIVNAERDEHPCHHVRRKMLVLWLLHNGITRDKAAMHSLLTHDFQTFENVSLLAA